MTIAPDRPATTPAVPDLTAILSLTGDETTIHDLPRPRIDWEHDAACRLQDPDWLPTTGTSKVNAAFKALCDSCPVARDCLLAALRADDRHRIAGGLAARERDRGLKAAGITRPTQSRADSALNRKPIPPRQAKVDLGQALTLRRQGLTIPQIAGILNVSRRAVREQLPARPGHPGKNRIDLGPEAASQMVAMAAAGCGVAEIAELFGCAPDTVRRRLKDPRP